MRDRENGLSPEPIVRDAVRFESHGTDCAAWHYPGTNGACVVMAAGLAVTKEVGTDRFARAFAQAGFTVLAFDYRRLGESGGHPRQIVRIREQLDDWRAALAFARRLPEVDARRVAIWGFSVWAATSFASRPRMAGSRLRSPTRRPPTVSTPREMRCAPRRCSRAFGCTSRRFATCCTARSDAIPCSCR